MSSRPRYERDKFPSTENSKKLAEQRSPGKAWFAIHLVLPSSVPGLGLCSPATCRVSSLLPHSTLLPFKVFSTPSSTVRPVMTPLSTLAASEQKQQQISNCDTVDTFLPEARRSGGPASEPRRQPAGRAPSQPSRNPPPPSAGSGPCELLSPAPTPPTPLLLPSGLTPTPATASARGSGGGVCRFTSGRAAVATGDTACPDQPRRQSGPCQSSGEHGPGTAAPPSDQAAAQAGGAHAGAASSRRAPGLGRASVVPPKPCAPQPQATPAGAVGGGGLQPPPRAGPPDSAQPLSAAHGPRRPRWEAPGPRPDQAGRRTDAPRECLRASLLGLGHLGAGNAAGGSPHAAQRRPPRPRRRLAPGPPPATSGDVMRTPEVRPVPRDLAVWDREGHQGVPESGTVGCRTRYTNKTTCKPHGSRRLPGLPRLFRPLPPTPAADSERPSAAERCGRNAAATPRTGYDRRGAEGRGHVSCSAGNARPAGREPRASQARGQDPVPARM